tara:strand:+ start:1287 stop:1952 length:666 start_codon:yes stop_codon:yes gene_type:complete
MNKEKVKVTPFKDTSMGKNTDSAIKQQVDDYVNKNKGDKPINKDLTIDKSAEGKAKYKALKQKKLEASIKKIRETEPENQSKEFGPGGQPSASVQIKKARLAGKTGREKAQELAKMRIASGKTIQKVKDDNTDAMKEKARARFDAFKAKRAAFKAKKLEKKLDKQRDFDDPNKKMNRGESYTPYDIVLDYLISTEQASTIEEANYIMTEMDSKTIQSIISD